MNGQCKCSNSASAIEFDYERVEAILKLYQGKEGVTIPVLQAVQEEFGYLPRPAIEHIARRLRIPVSRIYGVVTFYAQFHLKPRGKNIIRVCKGTACHVQGGAKIVERIEEILGIKVGETTEDLKFTLEQVACIGCCALAPVMMINNEPYGRLTPKSVRKILAQY